MEFFKNCNQCQNRFSPKRSDQKFCSLKCKNKQNNKKVMAEYHQRKQEDVVVKETHTGFTEKASLIFANPPFKGSLDREAVDGKILSVVDSKKTELLFLALILKGLRLGGRAAVIVPDGVLFGSSNAHQQLRKELIDRQKLQAVISMPSGVFKPYGG